MADALPDSALDQLFRNARTCKTFVAAPIADRRLEALYDLCRWGPTSMNGQPARFVFVRSPEAKARLRPALAAGNVAQTMAAPVTVIVAADEAFHQRLPKLFPAAPGAAATYAADPEAATETAFRNSTLQGAWLMMAARALGLACGAMSGFDNAVVDAAFFPESSWHSNFLITLGEPDLADVHPRGPRLPFSEACWIV